MPGPPTFGVRMIQGKSPTLTYRVQVHAPGVQVPDGRYNTVVTRWPQIDSGSTRAMRVVGEPVATGEEATVKEHACRFERILKGDLTPLLSQGREAANLPRVHPPKEYVGRRTQVHAIDQHVRRRTPGARSPPSSIWSRDPLEISQQRELSRDGAQAARER